MLAIHVPATPVLSIAGLPVTNAVLAAYVSSLFLIGIAVLIRLGLKRIPGRAQAFFEMIFEYIDDQLSQAFGSKEEGRRFFPLIMTLLLFIAIANQLSIFPLLFQVLVEGKPLLRLSTSDLSQTITLGLVVVGLSHVLALVLSPIKHIGNYIRIAPLLRVRSFGDLGQALIQLFLGLMDIIGELAKIVSLSCRLFGNLFAGDVMVAVIVSLSSFTQFIVPIPFLLLGLFSGFVQAFVFTLLSIQFLAGPVTAAKAHRQARLSARNPSKEPIAISST